MSGTTGKGYKQTPETLAAVVDGLRSGLPPKRAAMVAGISEKTFYTWRRAGWEAIEATDENSDEGMSFVVQFALQVEAALGAYMAPLIKRIAEAAAGRGKGDWRAAHAILAGRFPHEFSERVAVAKSARIEVSGGIDHSIYSVQLENMTIDELRDESSRHDAVICAGLVGASLDREITRRETVLADLNKQRDLQRGIGALIPGNLTRRPPLELADYEVTGATEFEHESNDVLAAVSKAPDMADAVELVAPASANLSHVPLAHDEPRPTRGIGYDQHGLAFRYDDEATQL